MAIDNELWDLFHLNVKKFMKKFDISFNESFFVNIINSRPYTFVGVDSNPMAYHEKFIIDEDCNVYYSKLFLDTQEYGYSPWQPINDIHERELMKAKDILKTEDLPFIRYGCLEKDGHICWDFYSNFTPKIRKQKIYFPITYIKKYIQPYMSEDWKIKVYYFIDTDSINPKIKIRKPRIRYNKNKEK